VGLNLSKIYKSAVSKITTQYLFDFDNKTFTVMPLYEKAETFRKNIDGEKIKEIQLQRNTETLEVFIKTNRSVYSFKHVDGQWLLMAEYKSAGTLDLDSSISHMLDIEDPIDPVYFNLKEADFRLAVSGNYNPIMKLLNAANGRLYPGRFSDQMTAFYDSSSSMDEIKSGNVEISIASGRPLYTLTFGEMSYPMPLKNGRFEIDRPVIDATVSSGGKWAAIRDRSITLYNNRSLKGVYDFGAFETEIPDTAFIEIKNGSLVINKPDGRFLVSISNGRAELKKYVEDETENNIYSINEMGLKVTKKKNLRRVYVQDDLFKGSGKFPFDRIREVAAVDNAIYLMTTDSSIWHYATKAEKILNGNYYKISSKFSSKLSFVNCSGSRVLLKAGDGLYTLDQNNHEEVERGECFKPTLFASETNWRWYLEEDGRGVFFEAREGDKWKKTKRQDNQGEFIDDRFKWIILFNNELYAAHGYGIIKFGMNGKISDFALNEAVQELKQLENKLFALGESGHVYEKQEGVNHWNLNTERSKESLFGEFIEVYSDPFVRIEKKGKSSRFVTTGGSALDWDLKRRRFKSDNIKDFVVTDNNLSIINGQDSRIVSYDVTGKRTGYYLKDRPTIRFERNNYEWLAISKDRNYNFVKAESTWKETEISELKLAEAAGIAFTKKLVSGNDHVIPVIGRSSIPDFWRGGKFVFDHISDLSAAGSRWWAVSGKGPLGMKTSSASEFLDLYSDIEGVSRIRAREKQVFIERQERVFTLDESFGTLKEYERPVFTRKVFDYMPDGETDYKWKIYDVSDRDPRSTFLLNTPWKGNISDVFFENRFFWDQIMEAAYDISTDKYWIVTPRQLTVNIRDEFQKNKFRLVLSSFSDTEVNNYSGYVLSDATVVGETLFILFADLEKSREIVRKMTSSGWEGIAGSEYPFWRYNVLYDIRENQWDSEKFKYVDYLKNHEYFKFVGPDDYRLFAELDDLEGFGRFSFDYIRTIHPVDDTVWAGSDGGLLKFRYVRKDDARRLELERILFPEDGLFNYSLMKFKGDRENSTLKILERTDNKKENVQTVSVNFWKENKNYTSLQPVVAGAPNKNTSVKLLFDYDPAANEGRFSIRWPGNEFTLFEAVPVKSTEQYLQARGSRQYSFVHDGESIEFDLNELGDEGIYVKLNRNTAVKAGIRKTPVFRKIFTDTAGFSWGTLNNAVPALLLPDETIIMQIVQFADISGLSVNESGLIWTNMADEKRVSYYYDADESKVHKLDGEEDAIVWVDYTPPPGTGITHYIYANKLLQTSMSQKFAKLIGRRTNAIKYWIELIAKKNNISKTRISGGDPDYHLVAGRIYRFPKKTVEVSGVKFNPELPLMLEDKEFAITRPEKENTGILDYENGLIGFNEEYFLLFDLERDRVYVENFPAEFPVSNMWKEDSEIMVGFVAGSDGDAEPDREIWKYRPFSFIGDDTLNDDLESFKKVDIYRI